MVTNMILNEKSMKTTVEHYDLLIDENNDPFYDSETMKEYMNKWDGDIFIDALLLDKGKSVLEIGVGTGRIADKVAPLCSDFTGIDLSPKTIERAKQNLTKHSNADLICGDFMTYRFGRLFDVVYSSLAFMHLKDKLRAVRKVSDLLNDGGRFAVSIDKNQSEFIDMGRYKVKIYPDTPDNIQEAVLSANMRITGRYETEFAYIFTAEK